MDADEKISRAHMPKIIRRYRALAGMSQQKLADSIGVSKGFISALEAGRSVPNIDMLILLANALGVRPGEMLDAMIAEASRPDPGHLSDFMN